MFEQVNKRTVKTFVLGFFENAMYMSIILLIRLQNFRKRKIHIAQLVYLTVLYT